MSGREEEAQWTALGHPEQRGPLAADGIHDGVDVVHPGLQGRRTGEPIRESIATLVEDDDSRKRTEPLQERRIAGQLVEELDVRNDSGHEDEVARTVADDLVRDADVAATSIARLGHDPSYRECLVPVNVWARPRSERGRAVVADGVSW